MSNTEALLELLLILEIQSKNHKAKSFNLYLKRSSGMEEEKPIECLLINFGMKLKKRTNIIQKKITMEIRKEDVMEKSMASMATTDLTKMIIMITKAKWAFAQS